MIDINNFTPSFTGNPPSTSKPTSKRTSSKSTRERGKSTRERGKSTRERSKSTRERSKHTSKRREFTFVAPYGAQQLSASSPHVAASLPL